MRTRWPSETSHVRGGKEKRRGCRRSPIDKGERGKEGVGASNMQNRDYSVDEKEKEGIRKAPFWNHREEKKKKESTKRVGPRRVGRRMLCECRLRRAPSSKGEKGRKKKGSKRENRYTFSRKGGKRKKSAGRSLPHPRTPHASSDYSFLAWEGEEEGESEICHHGGRGKKERKKKGSLQKGQPGGNVLCITRIIKREKKKGGKFLVYSKPYSKRKRGKGAHPRLFGS